MQKLARNSKPYIIPGEILENKNDFNLKPVNRSESMKIRKISLFDYEDQVILVNTENSLPNETNSKSEKIILSSRSAKTTRVDKFGNKISKSQKSHKISFADQFDEKLVNENKIISYREYNCGEINNEHRNNNFCDEFCCIY